MLPKLANDIELEQALCSKDLKSYMRLAWRIIEPARRFKDNWHIGVLCEHLEAVTFGQIRRLVINIPPGTTKSVTTSVMWPSWVWTFEPQHKWISASYSDMVARRDSLKAREIIESEWYQERWGDKFKRVAEDWSTSRYRNTMGGVRIAVTVGGSITGEHGDTQFVDDPIKPIAAPGDRVDSAAIKKCIEWWDGTMANRMADAPTGRRVVLMQRLHENDLTAHVFAQELGYEHLNLPMVAERKCVIVVPHKCSQPENNEGDPLPPTTLGYKDARSKFEFLNMERFPKEVVKERKKEQGPRVWYAQDQQRPSPSGGGIFKRNCVQYWKAVPRGAGASQLQSWDCAFKGLDDSDFVVGQVWAVRDGQYFLLDQVRDQMGISGTEQAILSLSNKWKKATRKLIEDKANGPAVIERLEKFVPGIVAVNPKGGKIARAQAIEPLWEARNIFLPHPEHAPWIHNFIEELVNFNGDPGRRDDQVDAMTQALVYMLKKTTDNYRKAMQQII